MPPAETPEQVRTPPARGRGGHHRPPSDRVLARVAELRAQGTTWPAVAARLGKREETVRKWPRKYPDRWLAAMLVAERRQALDSGAEAVLVLRTLLRSDDPKAQRDAAKQLIGLRVDLAKLDVKAKFAPRGPALSPDAARLLTLLDGDSDDELAELDRDLVFLRLPPHPAAPPGDGVPGPGPG